MSKARVLIIDDNETGIKVLSQMLFAMDISAIGLQDTGPLKAMTDDLQQLDAIFLDLEMPRINGYDVLRLLKNQFHVTAPIIAYSVHVSEIHRAIESGFNGFLGKPLHIKTFPGYMTRILNGEPVWEID